MSEYKVAWLIPTWNGARLSETLRSLPSGEPWEVVSTKERGWPLSRAWNYGAHKYLGAGYDVVILANDDILVRPDTGQQLAHGLLEAQFDPSSPALEPQHPVHGRELLLVTCYNLKDGWPDVGCRFGVGGPDYSCFAIGRKYLEWVGDFDEHFDPAFFEDNDSHYRIRLAGYEAAQWAPYWHWGSTTVLTDPERRYAVQGEDRAFGACRRYYVAKWGVPPEHDAPDRHPAGHETFTRPFDPASVQVPNPAYSPLPVPA